MPSTQSSFPLQRVSPVGPGTTLQLAVDKELSHMNARLYRQHGCYKVKINLLDLGTTVQNVEVFALANTWYVNNAIREAKKVHDLGMSEEIAHGGTSRWYDFRIQGLASPEFIRAAPSGSPVGPPTALGAPLNGEYNYSVMEDALGVSKTWSVATASGATVWNIFQEYDAMKNTSNDPGVPAAGGYTDATDALDNTNLNLLQERANAPPYDRDTLNPNVFVNVGHLFRDLNGNQRLSTGFFDAPLGLVFLKYGAEGLNPILELECATGNYKGVSMEAY